MTPADTARLLATFAAAYQIEIDDGTAILWSDLLTNVDATVATEAAHQYITLDADRQWMPKPAEFLATVKLLGDERERTRITEQHTESSYRCDGSRWRCYEHHGECPAECTVMYGLEPCPTCSPGTYDIFQRPEMLRRWRQGDRKVSENAVVLPACEPRQYERVVPNEGAARLARMAVGKPEPERHNDGDWSETRRDLQ